MKKFLGLVIAIGVLCVIGGTASAATCRGWYSWQLSVMDRYVAPSSHPNATAILTKCACNPVNNYLEVGVHIQYRLGNNYIWNPSSSEFSTDNGIDVASVNAAAYAPDAAIINYAQAYYYARCGSNTPSSFSRQWTGDATESFGEVEE